MEGTYFFILLEGAFFLLERFFSCWKDFSSVGGFFLLEGIVFSVGVNCLCFCWRDFFFLARRRNSLWTMEHYSCSLEGETFFFPCWRCAGGNMFSCWRDFFPAGGICFSLLEVFFSLLEVFFTKEHFSVLEGTFFLAGETFSLLE